MPWEALLQLLCNTYKGAVLKDHVLGKDEKNADGGFARKPGAHARKSCTAASACSHKYPRVPASTP